MMQKKLFLGLLISAYAAPTLCLTQATIEELVAALQAKAQKLEQTADQLQLQVNNMPDQLGQIQYQVNSLRDQAQSLQAYAEATKLEAQAAALDREAARLTATAHWAHVQYLVEKLKRQAKMIREQAKELRSH